MPYIDDHTVYRPAASVAKCGDAQRDCERRALSNRAIRGIGPDVGALEPLVPPK